MISIYGITRQTPKKNTVKTCKYVLTKFSSQFGKRDLASVSTEEAMDFLLRLTRDNKQATRRNRYSVLSSFYNFSINSSLPALANPCNASMMMKIYKRPQTIQWRIVDKQTIDIIVFRTTDRRNRLILELMARGGMRSGEVSRITPGDIQEGFLTIQNPKRGRPEERIYVPRKILASLREYVKANNII